MRAAQCKRKEENRKAAELWKPFLARETQERKKPRITARRLSFDQSLEFDLTAHRFHDVFDFAAAVAFL
jgi:hypothetical protein